MKNGIVINNELAKKIIQNAEEHGNLDDLQVGDIFCMYEYDGTPVLLNEKHKVMRVDSISVRGNRSLRDNLLLHVQPVIL